MPQEIQSSVRCSCSGYRSARLYCRVIIPSQAPDEVNKMVSTYTSNIEFGTTAVQSGKSNLHFEGAKQTPNEATGLLNRSRTH